MNKMIYTKRSLKRLRILVVEDSEVQKMIFVKLLSNEHIVRVASDVTEGWKLYLETTPQIVFLDIGLPDGNGNNLARIISRP